MFEHDYRYFIYNHAFIKVNATERKVYQMKMTEGDWIIAHLERLMMKDPNFLKHDIEFLWADQWITAVLIREGTRLFGFRDRQRNKDNIADY